MMLLAEVHGKRFPEAEGQEDWLTSAVFGHLRMVSVPVFWPELFGRACNTETPATPLLDELKRAGVIVGAYDKLEMVFWENCGKYGEPDLLLRFTGNAAEPLVLVIEVKLNSTKSGTGENDQLKRYFELLEDRSALPKWNCGKDHRYLIYLTQTFAKLELQESVLASRRMDAARRMFGMEWRDILAVSSKMASIDLLLSEVACFLKGRGFEAFNGMREPTLSSFAFDGGFYGSDYFAHGGLTGLQGKLRGSFYGQ